MYVDLSWDGTQSWIVKVYDEMDRNARCVRKDKQTADGQTKTRSDENLHKYIEVQTDKQTDKRTDKKMERLHWEIII